MVKLTCITCGKIHTLENIKNFSTCDCGANLLPSTIELIDSVENCIREIDSEINKHSAEGLCGKFTVEF